jgi:hypothetical protein
MEHLNEKSYNKIKKGLITLAIIVFVLFASIGGFLISKGIGNKTNIDKKYTEENRQIEINNLNKELASKKAELSTRIIELNSQIQPTVDRITQLKRAEFNGFNDAYYAREDEISALEKQIKPVSDQIKEMELCINDNTCSFSNDKDIKSIKEVNEKIRDLEFYSAEHERNMRASEYIPYFMLGGFLIIFGLMISGSILAAAFGRNILAWKAQQIMPVAQEGIEKMAPTIGKVGKSIAKEMAPVYGDIAKEVSKGIKEGLKDDNK